MQDVSREIEGEESSRWEFSVLYVQFFSINLKLLQKNSLLIWKKKEGLGRCLWMIRKPNDFRVSPALHVEDIWHFRLTASGDLPPYLPLCWCITFLQLTRHLTLGFFFFYFSLHLSTCNLLSRLPSVFLQCSFCLCFLLLSTAPKLRLSLSLNWTFSKASDWIHFLSPKLFWSYMECSLIPHVQTLYQYPRSSNNSSIVLFTAARGHNSEWPHVSRMSPPAPILYS